MLVLRSDMTVPIARLVATRYATAEPPLRFCYFAHAYRGVRPQRGQSREFLQAGIELRRRAGARGDGRGADGAVRRARRGRAARLPDRARRRRAVPALLDGFGVAGDRRASGCCTSSSRATSSASSARSRALGLDARRRRAARARPAAARRRRRCSTELDGDAAEAAEGLRGVHALLRAARRRARDLRPRPACASLGYYTGAVFEVYDPALGVPIGGGGRYDDLLGRFGRPLPAVGFALDRRAAAHRAGRRGARRRDERATRRPDDRRPARRAVRAARSTCSTRSASTPPRCAPTTASCCSSDVGIVTMRPSDVPTYVEAGAADIGDHRQGRADGAVRARGLRAARPRLRRAARWCSRPSPATDPTAEALRRLGVMRDRDEVPEDRRAPLRAHRPPGRDRRGQGLGRAGAADRAGRGDRRPHRDRHDAARERPRRARGDRSSAPRA